jgi:isopentenyldiphosphate isomerase
MKAIEELVDIIDEHDNVIGVATRARLRAEKLLHRGVFVIVLTSDDQIVVQQRSATKDLWPSHWDIGAGGVVSSGESYATSAQRELREELGIEAECTFLGMDRFGSDEVALIGAIYLARHDGPFHFVDGEVVAVETLTLAEFLAARSQRSWCPDALAISTPWIESVLGLKVLPEVL